ncbi:hypothetical protein NESM_000447900 [Novymonas esmeraldas]|uniref:Uncharacterized protein n=1 Tax=Novymonas esmeraldas TaxID=1808958 RepID=A0AAW0EQZ3_9TRYP
MSAHLHTDAAAAPALLSLLRRLRWDDTIRLVLGSDDYYRYRHDHRSSSSSGGGCGGGGGGGHADAQAVQRCDADADGGASAPAAVPSSWPARACRRLRGYMRRSSATRILVHAGALGYTLYVITHPSRHVPCLVTIDGAGAAVAAAQRCFLYESAEGMQLLMRDEMPRWVVFMHAAAGTLLLPLAIAQKESVWSMSFTTHSARPSRPQQTSATPAAAPAAVAGSEHQQAQRLAHAAAARDARRARRRHGVLGFATLLCVGRMVAGGVSLRRYSVFSAGAASSRAGVLNFASAMLIFALPWMVLAPATGITGRQAACAAHAMVGGLLVKAVLAVPFERVLGSVCQSWAGVKITIPRRGGGRTRAGAAGDVCLAVAQHAEAELEAVYYKTVLATTVVFGVWGVVDVVRFVRLARACVAADWQPSSP